MRIYREILATLILVASMPAVSATLTWGADDWSENSYGIWMYNDYVSATWDPNYTMPAGRISIDANNYLHAEATADRNGNSLTLIGRGDINWTNAFFAQPGAWAGGWINVNYLSEFTIQDANSTVNATVTIGGNRPAGSSYQVVIDTQPLSPQSRSSWPTQSGYDSWWLWILENSLPTGPNELSFEPGVTYYIYAYAIPTICVSVYCNPDNWYFIEDASTLGESGRLIYRDMVNVSFDFSSPAATIDAIDPIYGSYTFSPTAINNSGTVVGFGYYCCGGGPDKAFMWTKAGGRVTESYYNSQYRDINNNGDIAGTIGSSNAWYWPTVKYSTGEIVNYYYYPNTGVAVSLNENGFATGNSGATYGLWDIQNKLWTPIGFKSTSINNSNHIVGYTTSSPQAMLYDPTNGETVLGTLGLNSYARDINDSGMIIGNSYSEHGACYSGCGVIFSATQGVQVLPKLSTAEAVALSVNTGGEIVGYAYDGHNQKRAVLWRNGEVIDLNTLLPPGSGWVLNTAVDINDVGQIVGSGQLNGQNQIFVLNQ